MHRNAFFFFFLQKMEWHGRVIEVKGLWSKESSFVPVSKENLLSLIVLQQFFPKVGDSKTC